MISDYFRPTINCSSWSDRLSSTWTFLLLLILSIITGLRHSVGPNATCWTPVYFIEPMAIYTDTICWLGRKMPTVDYNQLNIVKPNITVDTYYPRTKDQRTLYQWFAAKYLQMANVTTSSRQVDLFISKDIGQDGVLLLEMIGETSSDILVRDIIFNIWHLHTFSNPHEIAQVEVGQNPTQQLRVVGIQKIYPDPDGCQVRSSERVEMEKPLRV